jgi:hypothetical protein
MIGWADSTIFQVADDPAEKTILEMISRLGEWTVNMSAYNFWPEGEEIAQNDAVFGIMPDEEEDEPDDCMSVFLNYI